MSFQFPQSEIFDNYQTVQKVKEGAFLVETEKRSNAAHEHKSMADLGYEFPMEQEPAMDLNRVDAEFWSSLEVTSGVDRDYPVCEGSLFDWDQTTWNLWQFPSPLRTLHSQGTWLPGISSSYLYYGSKFTCFPWHIEDWCLYSANILHWGLPKTWYSVPLPYARPFEYLGRHWFPANCHVNAEQPFHNKTLLLTPAALEEVGIPYAKVSN